jgi:hypothetical protein
LYVTDTGPDPRLVILCSANFKIIICLTCSTNNALTSWYDSKCCDSLPFLNPHFPCCCLSLYPFYQPISSVLLTSDSGPLDCSLFKNTITVEADTTNSVELPMKLNLFKLNSLKWKLRSCVCV